MTIELEGRTANPNIAFSLNGITNLYNIQQIHVSSHHPLVCVQDDPPRGVQAVQAGAPDDEAEPRGDHLRPAEEHGQSSHPQPQIQQPHPRLHTGTDIRE